MHRTWTQFILLNASVIVLCSHMREYSRLWSVYLSTIVPVNSVMFTYFLYLLLMVHSTNWLLNWFNSVLCVYLFVILFSLTRACALVDKKNRAVASQNRVLYVRFQKSGFPMPVRYLFKVR